MRLPSVICFVFFTAAACCPLHMDAQNTNQPLQKIINKDYPCSSSDVISIIGEKANIQVTGWTNKFIQVKIIFSAAHANKKIAARELEYMYYSITREKKNIELRNGFILPAAADSIQSKLEVKMEIMIPGNNQLIIKNNYGFATLIGLSGKLSTDIRFCNVTMRDIQGECRIQSSYSEMRGERIRASSFICRDEKSRFDMELDLGQYEFNSKFSELDLRVKNITGLRISSSRTTVTIHTDKWEKYYYDLINKQGTIEAPAPLAGKIKKEGKDVSLLENGRAAKPLIQIATTFNNITIRKNL